jgi:hypothetical protein
MKKHWIAAIASAFWLGYAAAQTWPAKPPTLIVGTPPGGAIDVYARSVAEHMGGTLGQQVLSSTSPVPTATFRRVRTPCAGRRLHDLDRYPIDDRDQSQRVRVTALEVR